MKRAILIVAAIGSIITAVNCGGTSSLENRPCPCTDGYVCCEATSQCINAGAACGGGPQEGGPGIDAGSDAKDAAPVVCGEVPTDPPQGDPGVPNDGGASGEGGVSQCPTLAPITAADIDADFAWKPPAAPQNVCAQADIDNLRAAFQKGGSLTFADLKSALGATCAACAFSSATGSTWQPFVEAAGGGGTIDNSLASCMTQVQGGACGPAYGAACGKARFRLDQCLEKACSPDACGGDVRQCNQKALKGACKSVASPYATACPDETSLLAACGNVLSVIANSCSGGPGNPLNTSL